MSLWPGTSFSSQCSTTRKSLDHDRLTALRLIYNRVARFPDDIESPSLLAMNVQLLLADRLNSIELLHLLTRLQYQLLGYEPRVRCAKGERRKVFGLYKNGEPILAGNHSAVREPAAPIGLSPHRWTEQGQPSSTEPAEAPPGC